MSEPRALRDMEPDERQLLKEAVCDAILERTRRLVSGGGEMGRTILGGRPSRVLSSGFILPRVDVDGDDESSDIRLASHGLDMRIRTASGVLRIEPALSVYIRTLPSAEDLFARGGRLLPRADLSDPAKTRARDEIRRRLDQQGGGLIGRPRRELRTAIAEQVYRDMGVVVPEGAILQLDADTDVEESGTQSVGGAARLRVPNAISKRHEAPLKWRRIEVPAPVLDLALPVADEGWGPTLAEYNVRLAAAIRDACLAYLATDEGRDWAWRRRRPESEDFWSPQAWEAFLARARADPPVAGDLVPQFQMQLLVQAIPDPTAAGCHSIRVALENLRESDADMECGLFNVSIRLEVPEVALAPMRLERVKRSYHLAGFMTMPAIGVNGGVEELGGQGGNRSLRTTWMPRYALPRMKAREVGEVPTAYSLLSDPGQNVEAISSLVAEMDAWRS